MTRKLISLFLSIGIAFFASLPFASALTGEDDGRGISGAGQPVKVEDGAVVPTDPTYTLGSELNEWVNAFFESATIGSLTASLSLGSPFISGSILIADNALEIAQDNANFFYDILNKRVGIRTNTPSSALEVAGLVTVSAAADGVGLNVRPTTNNEGLYLVSDGASMGIITGASEFTGTSVIDANAWTARGTSASSVWNRSGFVEFYTDSSLTDNATFTPTLRMHLDDTGHLSVGTDSGTATITAEDLNDDQLALVRNAGANEYRMRVGGSGDLIIKSITTEVARWLQSGELGLRTSAPIATLGIAPSTTGTSEPVLNFKQATATDRGYMVNVDNSGTGNWEITRRFDGGETPFQVWSGSKLGLGGIPDAGLHVIENTTSAGNTVPTLHIDQTDSGDSTIEWTVGGVNWTGGIDNGSADTWRLQQDNELTTSNQGISLETGGNFGIRVSDPDADLHVRRNDTVTADAMQHLEQAGTGDTFLRWSLGGASSHSMGIDNTDSDALIISAGSNLTSNQMARFNFSDGIQFFESFEVNNNGAGSGLSTGIDNIQLGTGDARYGLQAGGTDWVVAVDNSDGDSFKISNSVTAGSNEAFEIDTDLQVSVGGVTATQGRFEVHDNGNIGNTAVLIRLDDNDPWAMRIENATYGTGTPNSFRYFIENTTGDVRQYAPNKAGFLGDHEFWMDDTHYVTFLANGRTGVGGGTATDPKERMHINGQNDADKIALAIQNETLIANSTAEINFRTTTGTTDFASIIQNRVDSSNASLDFQTRSGGATTSALFIDENQDISITGGGVNINSGLGALADGLSFGVNGTGFAEISAGRLGFFTNNVETFRMRDTFGGIFHGNTVNSGAMMNEAATLTNPSFAPNRTDPDSGIGANGLNSVVLITDSTTAVEIDSTQHATFSKGINRNSIVVTNAMSPYTTQGEDIINVDTTGGVVTIDLATADNVDGRCIKIIDEGNGGTNNISLTTEGSELFQGAASVSPLITANFGRVEPCSNGTDWR